LMPKGMLLSKEHEDDRKDAAEGRFRWISPLYFAEIGLGALDTSSSCSTALPWT
jgi:hypothetical protein